MWKSAQIKSCYSRKNNFLLCISSHFGRVGERDCLRTKSTVTYFEIQNNFLLELRAFVLNTLKDRFLWTTWLSVAYWRRGNIAFTRKDMPLKITGARMWTWVIGLLCLSLSFQKPCNWLRFIKELCCQLVNFLTVFQYVHFDAAQNNNIVLILHQWMSCKWLSKIEGVKNRNKWLLVCMKVTSQVLQRHVQLNVLLMLWEIQWLVRWYHQQTLNVLFNITEMKNNWKLASRLGMEFQYKFNIDKYKVMQKKKILTSH